MTLVDERYWAEYDGLQFAKHQLLTSYLGGWFPILASWQGRVLYIDCHAGRGRHKTGHEGSPILALRLLLEHKHRSRILSSTEVHFFLFEIDQKNYSELCSRIQAFGDLPKNIFVHPYQGDYESHLKDTFEDLRANRLQLAPCFAFVDPYGFTISMAFLNDLLSFPRCELLINFMYRYIDMAIHQEAQAPNMDALFGCPHWRSLVSIEDPGLRAQETISLFSRQLAAEHVTHMHMMGENNALKYVLIHASNHTKGRQLMKQAMWSVTPDGAFAAHEGHSPDQLVLITPEPDLLPLQRSLMATFGGQTIPLGQLHEWLLPQTYLPTHLHKALRALRDEGLVEFTGYEGRFAFGQNPLVTFIVKPAGTEAH
jgi:three-Cys-motif partner protein